MKAMAEEKGKKDAGSGKAVEPARPRPTVMEFVAQVRQEVSKVTWPTRNETFVSTVAVFVMLALAAVFFFFVDLVLGYLVKFVMNLV
jgi:preprotein translocase subunit SecE